jgi:hypothetical protein
MFSRPELPQCRHGWSGPEIQQKLFGHSDDFTDPGAPPYALRYTGPELVGRFRDFIFGLHERAHRQERPARLILRASRETGSAESPETRA